MTTIVQDLCDQYHTFFYLQGDRKPCPYCKIMQLEEDLQEAKSDLRHSRIEATEMADRK